MRSPNLCLPKRRHTELIMMSKTTSHIGTAKSSLEKNSKKEIVGFTSQPPLKKYFPFMIIAE
jgi:hypothetical protein